MHYVYVIQSVKDLSFYVGRTADLKKWIIWHNDESINQGVTKRKIPWKYFYTLALKDVFLADKIERHIKRMKSRTYVINLAKYPEIGQKLIEKYS